MRREQPTLLDRYIAAINLVMRLPTAMRSNTPSSPVEARLRADLTELAHQVASKQLTWGTTGRLSGRFGTNQILTSPADKGFASLQASDFLLRDGRARATADAEIQFNAHRAVYAAQKNARVILQVQPPFTTVLVSMERVAPPDVPEVNDFWSRVAWVEPDALERDAVSDAIALAAQASNIILLKHRGIFCWSASSSEILLTVETVESVARMLWLHQVARSGAFDSAAAGDILARL